MNTTPEPSHDLKPPSIDPVAARRWQLAQADVPSPWLHEEVGQRMAQRLQWIRAQPQAWVDWCPLRGGVHAHQLVRDHYPRAHGWVVEESEQCLAVARRQLQPAWWRPSRYRAGARFGLQAPAAQAQLLWANMHLHHCATPLTLLRAWAQALAPEGFLMFSCLGPDSLRELRGLYQALGWPPAGHDFTDMHDWGDMLLQAGFAEPVMDMERIVLTYSTPQALLAELRQLGRNLHPGRSSHCHSRAWQKRLHGLLIDHLARPDGQLALTFEIIYGHAFKPQPRVRSHADGVATVGLDQMRAMLNPGRQVR